MRRESLRDMCREAGIWRSGNKRALAAGLINWRAGNYEGNGCYIRVDCTDAGQVLDLIKAPRRPRYRSSGAVVTSGSRLNVQFFTNRGVPPSISFRSPAPEETI